ncbi:hypothetical protein GSbR_18700 [Geobacter sp. SVR]|nr:hypothetical protein GSVR_33970 [Geobacter sp. SVR]GCF85270.1 hypothetical protein GSbR_18700 [Geobacter sp. SVR]
MAILLAMPAFALIIHSAVRQSRDSINEAIVDGKKLVYNIATEQYNLAGDAEQLLTILAQLPEIKSHNVAATNTILADILRKSPQYGNVVITDRTGEVWASGLPRNVSFSLKDSRTFQNALTTGRFSSGEYIVGRISARPTIGFGFPLLSEEGTVGGVIAVNINFHYVNELINHGGLPPNSSFSIIDYKGVIIDRNPSPEIFAGTRVEESAFLKMKNGPEEGSDTDSDSVEERHINIYRKLYLQTEKAPYLYIRASIPLQVAQLKAKKALIYNIAILTPFLLATVILVMLIGNYCFVRRINKLQEAAQTLAEEGLQVSVSTVVEGGELGNLALAFDEMARKLTIRELELVRNQEELNELNRSLMRRVEEETERRLKHERLLARHARLVAIGEMIGAIAHQWRQPLATLGATIQSIRMAWERRCIDDAFLENAEAEAQQQLYYMSDTIEDFRNFFNPEKVIEVFDLDENIQDVVQLVGAQFNASNVGLRVVNNLSGGRTKVRGYRNEFKQSVLNLVSNALDAINGHRQGGSGLVVIGLSEGAQSVVVEVKDNGCGIPKEYGDKVFEPYFTSKSEGKGTGIGLYMSRLIIEESMGGRLSFTSGPDGTVFRIELPRDESGEVEHNG